MAESTKELTNLDPKITEFQNQIRSKYDEANKIAEKGQILFVGSSLMEIFPIEKWEEAGSVHFAKYIYNRGVRATTTQDLLDHMNTLIFDLAPSKIFINIGSNDLGFQVPELTFLNNYDKILTEIQKQLPECQIYVMAYYPLNEIDFGKDEDEKSLMATRSNQAFQAANTKVEKLALEHKMNFINVNAGLIDEKGELKKELTFDGAHMNQDGYQIVLHNLEEFLK